MQVSLFAQQHSTQVPPYPHGFYVNIYISQHRVRRLLLAPSGWRGKPHFCGQSHCILCSEIYAWMLMMFLVCLGACELCVVAFKVSSTCWLLCHYESEPKRVCICPAGITQKMMRNMRGTTRNHVRAQFSCLPPCL